MDTDELERLLVQGINTDRTPHKQWCLMQALKIVSPETYQYELSFEVDEGIEP